MLASYLVGGSNHSTAEPDNVAAADQFENSLSTPVLLTPTSPKSQLLVKATLRRIFPIGLSEGFVRAYTQKG